MLTADTILGFGLVDFLGSSTIISGSTLTIPSGAAIRFDHGSTNDGPVVVNGTLTLNKASATLRINAALSLNASWKIINAGTISVAEFVNNGGTINGNAPVVLAASLAARLRIEQILQPDPAPNLAAKAGNAVMVSRVVVLKWNASTGGQFRIEATTDLRVWTNLPVVISEPCAGMFQVALPAEDGGSRFYRLRRL
ncbi:MAG: hypothetical protein IT579_23245 [Verrucomicrobia subdivision 3 bacterium]|nr:hypothetical protein [Limisphaerales bacterium]